MIKTVCPMKTPILLLLCLMASGMGFAQDTTWLLNTGMFGNSRQEIPLESKEGWLFKPGNEASWASPQAELTGWSPLKPTEIRADMADAQGRFEGWFRIKIRVDASFTGLKTGFRLGRWAAVDLYVDGNKVKSFGDTRQASYAEHAAYFEVPTAVDLKPGEVHVIALHVVDYVSPWHIRKLKSEVGDNILNQMIRLTGPDYMKSAVQNVQEIYNYTSLWISVMGLLSILFWLLYFQNADQRNLFLIALCTSAGTLNLFFIVLAESIGGISFTHYALCYYASNLTGNLYGILIPILLVYIFNRPVNTAFKVLMIMLIFMSIIAVLDIAGFHQPLQLITTLVLIVVSGYYIFSSWKNLAGAQWFVVAGLFISLIFSVLYVAGYTMHQSLIFPFAYAYATGIYLSIPVFLMFYVATRFREIIADVRHQTARVLQMAEEKKNQALMQQELLEREVARQTVELRESLAHLQSTQAQLIQAEKMASLGELTAGIAHEIQNPLNFVNNFSDLSQELIDEMNEELQKGNAADAMAIAEDVKQNLKKISHHGRRADAIVKGMLQHSRSNTGTKEPTDINALCDEYLRLAYHGLKARDKSFEASFHFEPDNTLPQMNVVPQDIGRVMLNLINNAFYAVVEKVRTAGPGYRPTVTVTTKATDDKVMITVSDNGGGIPDAVRDKIFQPFFTTKPTGEGTGLGLSLSYDIVTKGHGGELKMESAPGTGTDFIIQLPKK
jgi:signal transduction histidine kinase